MKNMKNWKSFNEDIGSDHQQLFDRSIYLTYVERHADQEYVNVDEKYFNELLSDKINNQKNIKINHKHSVGTEKDVFYDIRDMIIGEIWYDNETYDRPLKSFWVNSHRIKVDRFKINWKK